MKLTKVTDPQVLAKYYSEKGDKGDKGDPGEQGIQGPRGDKGDKGDRGEDGRGVASVLIQDSNLLVTYTDGTVFNAGSIVPEVEEDIRSTVTGNKAIQGGGGTGGIPIKDLGLRWSDYAVNWSTEPVVLDTLADGSEVYLYAYENKNLYRVVPSVTSGRIDSFYEVFSNGEVSGLVIERGMKL